MLGRKTRLWRRLTKGVDGLFRKHKITRYVGHGRISGPGAVIVETGKETVALKARWILIATGSAPANLPGVRLDGDRIGTSTEALGYPDVPDHLVIWSGIYRPRTRVRGAGSAPKSRSSSIWIASFRGWTWRSLPRRNGCLNGRGLDFHLGRRVTGRGWRAITVLWVKVPSPSGVIVCWWPWGASSVTTNLGLETVGITLDEAASPWTSTSARAQPESMPSRCHSRSDACPQGIGENRLCGNACRRLWPCAL